MNLTQRHLDIIIIINIIVQILNLLIQMMVKVMVLVIMKSKLTTLTVFIIKDLCTSLVGLNFNLKC